MGDKKYWKCKICQDIHYGSEAPKTCPTCDSEDAYVEVSKEDAKESLEM